MKTRQWAVIVACAGLGATGARAQAPDPRPAQAPAPAAPSPREAIEAEFRKGLATIEGVKIARLAALAAGQPKVEAARTYEDLFRFAISAGLYNEAEPVAERVLASPDSPTEVALLAEMVNLVAEANRGAYEQSLDSLSIAIQLRKVAEGDAAKEQKVRRVLPLPARLSLVSAYIQRLVQAGQYDVARKALTLIRDTTTEPTIKALVSGRLAQVDLVGKPAPAIVGDDLDGRPLRLDDQKGNLVLVVFWASWCVPNSQEAGRLGQVAASYRDRGFRVVGINLDGLQDGGPPPDAVLPNVRRFLLDHNVRWPNLLNGKGDKDYAKAYGVTELPTNVLIGRDGQVLHVDLTAASLESTLAQLTAR